MYFSVTEMKKNSQKMGREAEQAAREFLMENGYTILECNWRFKKYEIDIIGKKNEWMVFFEVKARSSAEFGEPELFVNKKKQGFLIAAADWYLKENNIEEEARFDIISLLQINNKFTVKHLEGAFYPSVK
jgi:putative endonuclease